jgi:carbonic anhydrase/acetyltransferase-like protein (isoleucine patch superfamily)
MILAYRGKYPEIAETAFVDESAVVIGDVRIGEHSSIWYNAVVRGDVNYIIIGENTNVQDGVIIHVTQIEYPTEIGDNVTIGHAAVLHGCKIKSNSLIGIGAIVLDGALIEEYCIVAAGSLVPPRAKYPSNSLILGCPAKVARKLNDKDIEMIKEGAIDYKELKEYYKGMKK